MPSVNEERPPISLRRFLQLERRIRSAGHTTRAPAPARLPPAAAKPRQADEILQVLGQTYRPGDRVGRREFAAAAGVSVPTAGAVRRWAITAGQWPYRNALSGFAARAVRRGRKKGGGGT